MKKNKKILTNKRRSFIKKAGLLTLGAGTVNSDHSSILLPG